MFMKNLLRSAFPVLLLCALAPAPAAAQEPALARTLDDPRLEWGPCPDLFPEGCAIAVLHGDPAKDNTDIYLKVPPNYRIPAHGHTSAERMVLVSGRLHITYAGQDEVVLEPGDYAYGPTKHTHEGFCAEGDPCVLFIAFESPVDVLPVTDATQAANGHGHSR